jgi:hypothetical protein
MFSIDQTKQKKAIAQAIRQKDKSERLPNQKLIFSSVYSLIKLFCNKRTEPIGMAHANTVITSELVTDMIILKREIKIVPRSIDPIACFVETRENSLLQLNIIHTCPTLNTLRMRTTRARLSVSSINARETMEKDEAMAAAHVSGFDDNLFSLRQVIRSMIANKAQVKKPAGFNHQC